MLGPAALALSACQRDQPAGGAGMDLSRDHWMRFPGKVPLRLLTDRPPQLETPLHYFQQDFTPNEAFFVRWHLAGIPTYVDPIAFRLTVEGQVRKPLELSIDDIKRKFEPVKLAAVNQCSGNSRSYFDPPVPGGQWRHGAMGNAMWTGARMKDVLAAAGLGAGAIEASFRGLDEAPLVTTPAFEKSLPLEKVVDPDTIIAYEMNGEALPLLNGYPMRLIVPGWYATYWVKALRRVTVRTAETKLKNFWMEKAYRIPNTPDGGEDPEKLDEDTVPINKFSVRSVIVKPEPAERVRVGQVYEAQGLAMDSGVGIRTVEVSTDGGKSWGEAQLDAPLGRYAWRRWRMQWRPERAGSYDIRARATNEAGQGQSERYWNHGGYMRNVIERVSVEAV